MSLKATYTPGRRVRVTTQRKGYEITYTGVILGWAENGLLCVKVDVGTKHVKPGEVKRISAFNCKLI